MTREERREYMRKYNTEHRDERRKYIKEHKEERKKYRAKHREKYNARIRKRLAEDLNLNGVTKNSIRSTSWRILKKCHDKLPNYEIHHCFGYENAEKFLYIPRELHIKIHQFLRDNHIPAHIDHFNSIRGLISSYPGYTYIHS